MFKINQYSFEGAGQMITHAYLDAFQKINQISQVKKERHYRIAISFCSKPEKLSNLEIEYRNILNVKWAETFGNGIKENSFTLWKKVMTVKMQLTI